MDEEEEEKENRKAEVEGLAEEKKDKRQLFLYGRSSC